MMTPISSSHRSLWAMIGASVVAVSLAGWGIFATPSAYAQGKAAPPEPDRQVRELEQRVKILELENETLDRRLRLEIDRNTHVVDDLDKRIKALESRDNKGLDPCREPYIHVAPGIVRVRPGCESVGGE